MLAVSRDFTQRHRLAEQLERQHRLLTSIVNESPIGIAVLDGQDFVHSLVNPALQRLAPIAAMGTRFAEVWPGLVESILPVLERVVQTGQPEQCADVVAADPEEELIGVPRGILEHADGRAVPEA